MPNSKSNHGGHRKIGSLEDNGGNHGGRFKSIGGKASSFHGRGMAEGAAAARLQRPKTVNDLSRGTGERQEGGDERQEGGDERPRLLAKLLLNVTIQGSIGAVHVVMRPESTVGDLITMAVAQYIKEGRRPVPPTKDPAAFNLHYSQFSLESLNREEKLTNLGWRNFFLCKRSNKDDADAASSPDSRGSSLASACSKEAEDPAKAGFNWLKFMNFLL